VTPPPARRGRSRAKNREVADIYRAGDLTLLDRLDGNADRGGPPFVDMVLDIEIYRQRGCRMLDPTCWQTVCMPCLWANKSRVQIEYNFGKTKRYRSPSEPFTHRLKPVRLRRWKKMRECWIMPDAPGPGAWGSCAGLRQHRPFYISSTTGAGGPRRPYGRGVRLCPTVRIWTLPLPTTPAKRLRGQTYMTPEDPPC
jgi:hypothetical protein